LTRHPAVINVIPNEGYNEFEVLQLASSAEIKSEHPIAKAIVNKAKEQSIPTLDVSEFNSISGYGVVASRLEKRIFVGSPSRNSGNNGTTIPQKMQSIITELESHGKTRKCIDSSIKSLFISYCRYGNAT
jgi:cation transport ATPase